MDPNHSPIPVLNCFIIIAMASLGAMHVRCFWRIWRKMDREVKKGEEDLFRDFDWTLFDSDDRARFREKYPNTHWKFPQMRIVTLRSTASSGVPGVCTQDSIV